MPRSEPYERLGARRLGLPDVIGQSVGFMGPVFSAAFLIPLVAGVISASGRGGGGAAPLSVLIAAAGILALAFVVAAYAREVPAAGSLYDYVSRGLGARVGTAAGWLYYCGLTVLLAGLLLLIGGYLQGTVQANFGVRPLPAWAWTLLAIAVVAAAGYFGVRLSARSQLALALVSMLVVAAFLVMVIVRLGGPTAGGHSARPGPARGGPASCSGRCTGSCCSPGSRRPPTWPRRPAARAGPSRPRSCRPPRSWPCSSSSPRMPRWRASTTACRR